MRNIFILLLICIAQIKAPLTDCNNESNFPLMGVNLDETCFGVGTNSAAWVSNTELDFQRTAAAASVDHKFVDLSVVPATMPPVAVNP